MSPLEILTWYGAISGGATVLLLALTFLAYRDDDYPDPHEPEGELVELDEWR